MLVQTEMTVLTVYGHEDNFAEIVRWCKQHSGTYCLDQNGTRLIITLDITRYELFCKEFNYEFDDWVSDIAQRAILKYKASVRQPAT